jgi:F0F1-type ATP synthase membrane subunit b/b'
MDAWALMTEPDPAVVVARQVVAKRIAEMLDNRDRHLAARIAQAVWGKQIK